MLKEKTLQNAWSQGVAPETVLQFLTIVNMKMKNCIYVATVFK